MSAFCAIPAPPYHGSTFDVLDINGTGDITVDTVLTYDPAEGCTLIATSGVIVPLALNDTGSRAPMIEFSMNPSTAQSLSSVSLGASGSGNQHTYIEHVQLYEDLNGNGKVDAGEPLLGSGAYGVDNTIILTVDPAFVFTGPTNFLVTYDFNVTIVQELVGGTAVLAMFPLLLLPVMRRRRRTILLGIAMLTVSVAALSSCGGSDTSTGPPAPKGSSTNQAEVTSVTRTLRRSPLPRTRSSRARGSRAVENRTVLGLRIRAFTLRGGEVGANRAA